MRFKQRKHAVNIFDIYYIMIYNDAITSVANTIPSVANTLNKIHFSTIGLNEFTSTYYYGIDGVL